MLFLAYPVKNPANGFLWDEVSGEDAIRRELFEVNA